MIEQTETRRKLPAITSNRWHVVHAKWCGTPASEPFERQIVSEHEDRAQAVEAAKSLLHSLHRSGGERAAEQRDQVFVRRPNYKSLAFARRRERPRS
jgi:hypothetical protein